MAARLLVSRRAFVRTLGAGAAGTLAPGGLTGRGGLAPDDLLLGRLGEPLIAAERRPLLLHNNENPLGPGERVLAAVRAVLFASAAPAGRYAHERMDLVDALARSHGVPADHVMVGTGSTQILRTATHVFTSASRRLVSGEPSYEECVEYAKLAGSAVRTVPLEASLRLDLDAMAAASESAGMVFLNNPNNPTGTAHSSTAVVDFVERVLKNAPDTTIMIDEAYHDYVTDPSYRTQIPLAINSPRVIVTRTFSKAHGMAGLRVGYAIARPETLHPMREWQDRRTMNVLGMAAAIVSISDPDRIERERDRNLEARQFTMSWFERAGYKTTDSQTNFIFIDIRQPLDKFREACRKHGVLVGRPFPPLTSYARVSIGTLEEMRRATDVFGKVLRGARVVTTT